MSTHPTRRALRSRPAGIGPRRRALLLAATASLTLPSLASAQGEKRRIGVLMHLRADDPEAQARNTAFLQGLEALAWRPGHNLAIDYRWSPTPDLLRQGAAELVALAPEVLVTTITGGVRALQQATRTIPIVFSSVIDPVGSGLVDSLARPGANSTGFALFEYGVSAKWLELLKQLAPGVKRVGVARDPTIHSGIGQFASIQAFASSQGVELRPIDVTDAGALERTLDAFVASGGATGGASGASGGMTSGLIVTSSPNAIIHRDLIVAFAARHRLPAVYPFLLFAQAGGLMSYGPDLLDVHRRSAGYVDVILKGKKPTELPVQAPTKYDLVINLRTARTLGLTAPPSLLARANEVIE